MTSFRFQDLSAELRNDIYRECLSSYKVRKPFPKGGHSYEFNVALLQVNKQIRDEATPIFRQNVFVTFTGPMLWSHEKLLKASGHLATTPLAQLPNCRLAVILSATWLPKKFRRRRTGTFITLIDNMDVVCKSLSVMIRSIEPHPMSSQDQQRTLEFELTGADVSTNSKHAAEAFQHSLLEPFSSARGLHGIRLQGFRNVAEAKEPFSSLLNPAPHPAACIVKGKKLFDAGNLALKSDPNTGPKLAIRAYEKAIKNLLIDYESDICELPARRIFDSYNVSVIVGHRLYALPGELRTNLKKYLALHMMFAYLISYDWESAFIWGKRTIALARPGNHEDRARVQAGQSKIWSRPLYRTPVCYEMAFVAHLLGNRVEEVKLLQGVSRFVKAHRPTCDNIKRGWPGESSAPGIREAALRATVWEKICRKEDAGLDALGGGSG